LKCINLISKCLKLEDILLINKAKLSKKCKEKIGLVKLKENKEHKKKHKLKKQKRKLNYKLKGHKLNLKWIKLMEKIN
jgi:hypothetical protein